MGANIPLPALHVNPPQEQEGPLQQFAKMMAIRNAQQQQQLGAEQITGAQQENQVRAIQLQDQQAMTKAMQEWDGKDLNALVPLVVKNGGSANAVMGLKKNALDMQEKYSTIAKNDAETGGKQLENMAKRNDMLLGKLQSVTSGPDEGLGERLAAAAQEAVQSGLLDPQHAQAVSQLVNLPPQQLRQQLTVLEKSFLEQSTQMSQAKEQAQTREANATAAKTELETSYGGAPEMQKARYNFVLQRLAAKQQVSPDDMAAAVAYEAANSKTTTTSDSLGVSSTNTSKPTGLAQFGKGRSGGGTGGGTSGAGAKGSIVDLIGEYRADPALLSRMFYKHPELLGLIQQKYPDFDQTTYTAKNKLIQGYTSGTQAKEINAINTAMGHINVLDQAVDALHNKDLNALNAIANKIGVALGKDPVTTFNTILHRVGPEITSAYVPGAGGEAERIANAEDFSASRSPEQLHSAAAVSVKLLRSKVGALENQYKNTVGRDDFQQRFITPEAQRSFNRFAQQGSGGAPKGPQVGQTITLKNGKTVKVTAVHSDGTFDAQ